MAWQPKTEFDEDIVALQPDHDFIFGHPLMEQQPPPRRPKEHYSYLEKRQEANRCKERRAGLEMMEQIQKIAGTKPLGDHATFEDLEDTSTVEQEAVALMRHFGMMSMANASLTTKVANHRPGQWYWGTNPRRKYPLILPADYFDPKDSKSDDSALNGSSEGEEYQPGIETDPNQTTSSCGSSAYATAKSSLDTSGEQSIYASFTDNETKSSETFKEPRKEFAKETQLNQKKKQSNKKKHLRKEVSKRL